MSSPSVAFEPARPSAESEIEAQKPWPRPTYAWCVLAILLTAYAFAILDRTAISLLVDPIKQDLKISNSQIGLLQGAAFALCYTTFGLPLGYLSDRWKRRPLLAIGIAVWSAATIACGLARSFGMLFLARVGVGVGEASITPAAGSLIADYFPPEQRPKAYSIWMMGGSLGNSLSPLFAAMAILLADHLHRTGAAWAVDMKTWQIAFFLVGAPGLVVALVFWLVVAEPVRRQRMAASAQGFPLAPLWAALTAQRGAYATLISAAVLNVTCIYASIGWMPTLFVRVHQWSPVKIGAAFSLVNIPVALCGALVAGWAMSWLARRGRRDAPLTMVLGHACAILLCGTVACLSPWPTLTLALNAVTALTSTWSYAAAMTGLNQITPNELRGQIAAIFTLCTGLFSMTVGSFAVGFLSDVVFRGPGGVAPSLACVFAVCAVGSIAVLLAGRHSYRRAERAAQTW